MTGLFELLNPVFALADGLLGWLPDIARIAVWGVLAGAASMAIYARASPQERLAALAAEACEQRRAMRVGGDSAAGTMHNLLLSLRRLGASLGPTLLSSLPVLFMLGYLNAHYSLEPPVAGEPVTVLSQSGDDIRVEGGQRFAAGWTVAWPNEGETVRVFDNGGEHILTITPQTQPGTARQGGLTAFLLGAQAGELAAGGAVDALEIETTPRAIVQPGLAIHYQWTVPFLLAVVLASLSLKFALRIA